MKTVAVLVLVALLLLPGVAMADAATDAALGLGAFAVFNQIISGTGIFGGLGARPVVVAPPPVYVRPAPVYVYPTHPRAYSRAYGHPGYRGHWKHDRHDRDGRYSRR